MSDTRAVHPIQVALQRQWPPMSQAKLARQIGMNEGVLSRYLNGRGKPPEGFFIAVADVLGCTPDELKPEAAAA